MTFDTSDTEKGLLVANAPGQPLVLRLPVRVFALGDMRRLHHSVPQVSPAGLGDAPRSLGLAALMHTGA